MSTALRQCPHLPPPPPPPPPMVTRDPELFLWPDGRSLGRGDKNWISDGLTGIVLRRGETVVKIPKIRKTSDLYGAYLQNIEHANKYSLRSHGTETQVYQRLGNLPGIVKCYAASPSGIELMYMESGTIEDRLKDYRHPIPNNIKIQWIRTIVHTVSRIHEKNVVMLDLAPRNILVGKDGSIKLCDFGNALLLPISADISVAQRDGLLSVQQDIFDLGWILYSISAGRIYHSRLTRQYSETDDEVRSRIEEYERDQYLYCKSPNAESRGRKPTLWSLAWPESLPNTDGVLFGDIIQRCWTEDGYQSVAQICKDIYHPLYNEY